MPKYLAVLGNTPQLSLAELSSVYQNSVTSVGDLVAEINFENDDQASQALGILGGTSKILKVHKEFQSLSADGALEEIVKFLSNLSDNDKQIDFAISELGRDHLPVIDSAKVKKNLKAIGIKSRYVDGSRHGLSSASLKSNNKLSEVIIVQAEDRVYLSTATSFQDVDDWARRDRQKPFAEHKRGLLPPKIARMMVNLAIGNDSSEKLLLDPFCGAGTILLEALLRGVSVVGADIEKVAVEGTKINLDWFKELYPEVKRLDANIEQADAAHLSLEEDSVTHLVTEPFLGKPRPRIEQLPNIFKGLEKLYLGAFKNWRKFLKNESTIVIVFPVVEAESSGKIRRYTLDNLIDKLSDLGYTTTSEPILYSKPSAQVKRAIYQFIYVKS